jgi:hypothetical protein
MTADTVTALLATVAKHARTSIAYSVEARVKRATRKALLLGVASTFGAIALGFAGYAAYVALAPLWTPALAALAVAGGALMLAGVCVMIARQPAPAQTATASGESAPDKEGDAIAAEIAGLVTRLQNEAERNGESLVVGSLAAGIALALLRKPR